MKKKFGKGRDRRTSWKRSKKDHDKLSEKSLLGRIYDPERWEGEMGREGIAAYDNKAGTRETRDAKHWRQDQKKEERRTKSQMQNQKEGVVRPGQEGSPDPRKTHQIRKQARRGERLLHEDALAGGGFGFAGGRLFLYLTETKFKHFGYRTEEKMIRNDLVGAIGGR